METTKIRSKIFNIIVPIMLENILQLSASLVSMAMIGRIGSDAVNSIGLSTRLTQIVWAIFRGIATGTSVFVSQSYGAQDIKKLKNYSFHAIISSVFFGIILQILIFANSNTLLSKIFNPDSNILPGANLYLKITSFGLPFMIIMLMVTGILQGMNNTKTPMYIALIMNFVNVILNYVLIYGRLGFSPLGLNGAAIALIISQGIGALIGLTILFNKNGILNRIFINFKLNLKEIKNIYAVGLPASFESIFWQFAAILITRAILIYGSKSFAAYQLGLQAEAISYLPATGFAVASTTLIGQALGAKDSKIGKLYLKEIVKNAVLFTSIGSIVLIFFPSWFMRILTDDVEVIKIGAGYLFYMGLVQIPQNVSQVFNGALRGAGYTRIPMIVAGIGLWGIRVPFTLLMAYYFKKSITFIWLAICIDLVFRFLLSYILYKVKNIYEAKLLIQDN